MSKADWIWMPRPAHRSAGRICNFHLATYVGGYIVSTIGTKFHYETHVFKAQRAQFESSLTPWEPVGDDVDSKLYPAANPKAACEGHLAMCDALEAKAKLARKQEIALDSNAKRKANGTKAGRKPSVWPEVAFKIKVARFNDGRTIRWIAKEFGISTTTVQRIIKGGPA